ncbi:hypothetical protein BX666DRAFT_1882589 [Dichotomocladium elegans]|nr:hypothetical protein BX666DRAFT_1882589 [Dichotomocladium elegans]
MSTPDRTPNRKLRFLDAYEGVPFTVDNTENRFSSRFSAQTPTKSILKESRTPDPYGSPFLSASNLFGGEDGSLRSEFDADISSPTQTEERRRDLFGSPHEYLSSPKRNGSTYTTGRPAYEEPEPLDFEKYMAGRAPPNLDDLLGDDSEEDHAVAQETRSPAKTMSSITKRPAQDRTGSKRSDWRRGSKSRFSGKDAADQEVALYNITAPVSKSSGGDTQEGMDTQHVQLPFFMSKVGIPWKRAEVPVDRPRTYPSNRTASSQPADQAALCPELKGFTTYCEQLEELVSGLQKDLEVAESGIEAKNPALFRSYFSGDTQQQSGMEARFQQLWIHASMLAKKTLYEWKHNVIQELLDEEKQCLKETEKVERFLADFGRSCCVHFDSDAQLQTGVADLQERVLDKELSGCTTHLQTRQEVLRVLDKQQLVYTKQAAALQARKEALMAEIGRLKKAREDEDALYTERNLVEAKESYERCERVGGWKLIRWSGPQVELLIDNDINIVADKTKLDERRSDAILVRMMEQSEHFYGAFSELMYGLQEITKDVWDIGQIARRVALYWQNLRLLYREIRAVRKHNYWLKASTAKEEDEHGQQGIFCTVVFASFVSKAKIILYLRIWPRDVIDFPTLRDDILSVKVEYAPVPEEKVETIIRDKLRQKGFIGFADTLKDILRALDKEEPAEV